MSKISIENIDPNEIREIAVYSFSVGDAEDPDLYAAEPLINWEKSEQGQWIMAHAVETPVWHRTVDHNTFGYRYRISARLKGKDLTYFYLKWGDGVDKQRRWR